LNSTPAHTSLWIAVACVLATFGIKKAVDEQGNIMGLACSGRKITSWPQRNQTSLIHNEFAAPHPLQVLHDIAVHRGGSYPGDISLGMLERSSLRSVLPGYTHMSLPLAGTNYIIELGIMVLTPPTRVLTFTAENQFVFHSRNTVCR
jgi:hypothetical protein